MTIVYEVSDGLYINLTNRCTNRCEFCIRNNGDGAYGSEPLWLEREPTAQEVIDAVFEKRPDRYKELVFCGYGEPTCRLDVMLQVAREIKTKYPKVKIRVNTNGHSDLINGKNTATEFQGAIDVVSVSLNSPIPDRYNEICHPVYKEKAFSSMLSFASNVKKYVDTVIFSVVRQTLTEDEIAECERIAARTGVGLKIRDYIS